MYIFHTPHTHTLSRIREIITTTSSLLLKEGLVKEKGLQFSGGLGLPSSPVKRSNTGVGSIFKLCFLSPWVCRYASGAMADEGGDEVKEIQGFLGSPTHEARAAPH